MIPTGAIPMQGQRITMTPAELEALPHAICKQCGFDIFLSAVKLKKVSLLMSKTGRTEVIPMPVFVCASCHYQLLPKDIEDATKESKPELPDDVA